MKTKKLVLHDKHLALGAKMVSFAGFEMPLKYGSEREEHINVRQNAGVFDVSHMGEFLIKGAGALPLIQMISSNDASILQPGRVQYSCMPNDSGGIVDDLLVYQLKTDEYMLVVNAANIEKDWEWINSHNDTGAVLENISDEVSLFALQGPNSKKILQQITSVDLEGLAYYTFATGNIGDITAGAIVSATGYTGAGGFELFIYNEYARQVWDAIFAAGESYGLKATGLGARDTLRLEMGYCLYGNDIDDTTSPLEAGLGWITKFNKNFIHSDLLKKQRQEGVKRKLVGFKMLEKGIPRAGYSLYNADRQVIGEVTSGTMSPSLNIGIGMGYVKKEFTAPGTMVLVGIRNRMLKAEIVKLPFIKE